MIYVCLFRDLYELRNVSLLSSVCLPCESTCKLVRGIRPKMAWQGRMTHMHVSDKCSILGTLNLAPLGWSCWRFVKSQVFQVCVQKCVFWPLSCDLIVTVCQNLQYASYVEPAEIDIV